MAPPSRLDRAWQQALRMGFPLLRLWWLVRRPTLRGAYVAVWHAERVLVIRNSYKRSLTFPCGQLARGESTAEAAARELEEEVGLRATPEALHRALELRIRAGPVLDHVDVFELRLEAEAPPRLRLDQREVVWGAFVDPDTIREEEDLAPAVRRYLAAWRAGEIVRD